MELKKNRPQQGQAQGLGNSLNKAQPVYRPAANGQPKSNERKPVPAVKRHWLDHR